MNAKAVAQEAANWYLSHLDPYASHVENVQQCLKRPILALTLKILDPPGIAATAEASNAGDKRGDEGDSKPAAVEKGKKKEVPEKKEQVDWRVFLSLSHDHEESVWTKEDQEAYDKLGRRTISRLEAFLAGCALCVPYEISSSNQASSFIVAPTSQLKPKSRTSSGSASGLSLDEGLSGFGTSSSKESKPKTPSESNVLRNISSSKSTGEKKHAQISKDELVVRLEIYVRTMERVKASNEECVITMEPAKVTKARANAIVRAFVQTVGCVRDMSPVLTGLLGWITKEILAVDTLCDELTQVIRRVVSEYEHEISFASLAFLSSPEVSADTRLTPLVVKYLRYVQSHWEKLVTDCELERMLSVLIDKRMRNTFKTIEFQSIGHLLEVCHEYRNELQNIALPPNMFGDCTDDVTESTKDPKVVRQALRDLQREIILVNGQPLPPVSSRRALVQLLSQALNSRVQAKVPRLKKSKKVPVAVARAAPSRPPATISIGNSDTKWKEDEVLSSGCEEDADTDSSPAKASFKRRVSRLHLSTIDLLTRRLLIAASRTGTGGDTYFVVRDLFGDQDVEVVPTTSRHAPGIAPGRGTIEIIVRLASVTIKCHGSFDVYPKSLVGECVPLIQIHTTTTETIYLQEVRATDDSQIDRSEYDSDDDINEGNPRSVMVLQERKTPKTGWRTLSIRPALYEKVEVWNTPS